MKVVYFVISVIEIILTAFIVSQLIRAEEKINSFNGKFEEHFGAFYPEFKKCAKILSVSSKIFKTLKKTKNLKKIISGIKSAQSVINLLSGRKMKFKLFPVLRKILFYI